MCHASLLNEPAEGIGRLIDPLKDAARDNATIRVICGDCCGNVLLFELPLLARREIDANCAEPATVLRPLPRHREGPALSGGAAPLAARGDYLDCVGPRGEHAGLVAQVAGGPAIVKAPLLGPV
jgi:hypothetical protein